MTKQSKTYRYELVHGGEADFIAYQRKSSSDGLWQTLSIWMIPPAVCG